MAYDRDLAERVRDGLAGEPDLTERAMFGGLAFMLGGHMTVVVGSRGGLMLRLDPTVAAGLVETTTAEYAEMRGRPMRGWLTLTAADVHHDDLAGWLRRAVSHSHTLPPKT